MSEKHKNVCETLNYIDHFFRFFISIFNFASLIGISLGMTSNTICVIAV